MMASEWDVIESEPTDTGWEVERRVGVRANLEAKPTRSGKVVSNAIKEAAAGIPDMFLNAPSNLMNLGRASKGMLEHAIGDPGQAPNITPAPSPVRGFFEKQGWITPQEAPETRGEGYLAAGAGGATAGAMGGLQGSVIGAILGLVGQGATELTDSPIAGILANLLTAKGANVASNYGSKQVVLANQLKSQKQPLIDTINEVRGAGYVMPPSTTNPDSMINKILEGIGGKAATQQDVSMRNSAVTDALGRRQLGMPAGAAITEDALNQLKMSKAGPYNDMSTLHGLPPPVVGTQLSASGLGPVVPMYGKTPKTPDKLVHDWKSTNAKAKLTWKEYERGNQVEALDRYNALRDKSAQIERDLEAAAQAANRPDMVEKLRAARKDYAQINDVERALNPERGEVSTLELSRAKDKGVPFTGDLLTAAKMGSAFPKSVQRPETIGSPGVNNLNSMLGSGAGASLGAILGGPIAAGGGAVAGAVATPYIQSLVRQLLLSKGYQKSMGTPNYDASMIGKTASKIPMTTAYEALLRAYIQAQQLQGHQ